jgi:hypothetical protein
MKSIAASLNCLISSVDGFGMTIDDAEDLETWEDADVVSGIG